MVEESRLGEDKNLRAHEQYGSLIGLRHNCNECLGV